MLPQETPGTIKVPFLGYDYGVPPRLGVMGDIEFPSLLARSLRAVGYGEVPQFGAMANVPILSLFLESDADARSLFDRFRTWSSEEFYARGVRFSFAEFADNTFGLCVVQDESALLRRLISSELNDEVDPVAFVVGHLKRLSQLSESYRRFKTKSHGRPILIGAVTPSGVLPDCEIVVEAISYYNENSAPNDSIERFLLSCPRDDAGSSPIPQHTERHVLTPEEIAVRRSRQIRRFFPVTLERLRTAEAFQRVADDLRKDGYSVWQIHQAACNMTLDARFPDVFAASRADGDMKNVSVNVVENLRLLLEGYEDPQVSFPIQRLVDNGALRQQIALDSRYLLEWLTSGSSTDLPHALQDVLAERGLLDECS